MWPVTLYICCSASFYELEVIFSQSTMEVLTLKAPIMTAADDIHKYCFHCFSEKIRLDVSRDSSAKIKVKD